MAVNFFVTTKSTKRIHQESQRRWNHQGTKHQEKRREEKRREEKRERREETTHPRQAMCPSSKSLFSKDRHSLVLQLSLLLYFLGAFVPWWFLLLFTSFVTPLCPLRDLRGSRASAS